MLNPLIKVSVTKAVQLWNKVTCVVYISSLKLLQVMVISRELEKDKVLQVNHTVCLIWDIRTLLLLILLIVSNCSKFILQNNMIFLRLVSNEINLSTHYAIDQWYKPTVMYLNDTPVYITIHHSLYMLWFKEEVCGKKD